MSNLLDELNPQQRAAVELTEGPLLILAGAGSGKTRVITYRIAYLIETKQVPPERILAVTFTNKAADQMKERVAALVSQRLATRGSPQISTFHSFCVRVLRRDIDRLGYTRDFSIYDEDNQLQVMKACVKDLGLSQQFPYPRVVRGRISYSKNLGLAPEEVYRQAANAEAEKLASVWDLYERKLRQANALDFDDLLLKTVELFYGAPEICERYSQRCRYIHVDEYQDTNRTQYQLIRQLTLAHQNLCAVGDEDQSIYRWRGADIQNILSFERDYPGTRIIRLEQNYRSTQLILDAATAVVSRNQARKGKTLWTERGQGQRIVLFQARDAEDEGLFVARQIAGMLAASANESIAVLFRTNAQSRVLEEALRRSAIDYRVVGGFSFYARAEIKDALAYARLANNLRDSAAFVRIVNTPPRGIGETTLGALEESARQHRLSLWEALEAELANRPSGSPNRRSESAATELVLENELGSRRGGPRNTGREGGLPERARKALASFYELMRALVQDRDRMRMSEFFRSILERTGYLEILQAEHLPESESRVENLKELVNAAAAAEGRGETLAEFLDRAALVSEADDYDERARVTLLTLHCAKGLEFSTVYLVGLEEGLFPHKLSTQTAADIEEERRLCYVGMTRAKDQLILTWARQRRSFGQESFEGTKPSRFLKEIPAELVTRLGTATLPTKPRPSWETAVNSVPGVERFLRRRGHPSRKRRISFAQPSARRRWELGTRVRHPKYGLGTVLDCEGEGDDAKLTVSFPGYGQKKLVERYASLEEA